MSLPEVSLNVKPAAHQTPAVEKKCAQCGKTDEKIKRCACHLAWYCDQVCQKAHWPSHKQVCALKPREKSVAEKLNARFKKEFAPWVPDGPVVLDYSPYGLPKYSYGSRRECWADWMKRTKVKTFPFFENFYKRYPEGQKGKALDLGCFGKGGNSHFLLQKGWKVTAVNFCEEVLKLMRETAQLRNQEELVLTNADINDYAFPEKFDLILAIDILPYTNPKKICDLLQKIYASLNENGYFVGSFFIDNPAQKALVDLSRACGGWFFDNPETVRSLFNDLHFIIVGFEVPPSKDHTAVDFAIQKKS